MRFGLFYEHQLPRPWAEGDEERLLGDALEQIELADRVGFDSVWEVEHHFLEEYSHSSAPEVFLAACSQRTRRLRLGHGIVQTPPGFNHPARVAERVATLDLLSGGRVEFGTGESASQAELGGFLVDRNQKHAQWDEALDAIARMFVEEPFAGYEGRFVRMPQRQVLPRPKQKPHPPLWMACSRRESILTAARKGIGALSFSFIEPEEARGWVQDYYRIIASDECVAGGFAVNPQVAVVVPMMCHAEERTAIERGIDGAHFFGYSLAYYYIFGQHQPGRTHLWQEFQERRNAAGFAREIVRAQDAPLGVRLLQEGLGSLRGAIGTPRQIAELVERYERAGVDQVIFVCQAGRNRHEHICESIELFSREVLPRFAEATEQREREKQERLAEACTRAVGRRAPARKAAYPYVVSAQGEPFTAPPAAPNALARFVRGRDDRQLERWLRHRAVQHLLFRGLERAVDPARAGDFTAEVQYDLQGHCWVLALDGGRAKVRRGRAAHPALTFRMCLPLFARIAAGEVDATRAMLERKLEVEGDVKVLARFSALFPRR